MSHTRLQDEGQDSLALQDKSAMPLLETGTHVSYCSHAAVTNHTVASVLRETGGNMGK